MAVEQKVNGWEGASHMKVWGKNIPGWEKGKGKGPEGGGGARN